MTDVQEIHNRIVLGLDASTVAIGWALMDYNAVIYYGVQELKGEFHQRLLDAHEWLGGFLDEHSVHTVAIERPVAHRNIQTTIRLANISGALRVAIGNRVSNVVEINPGERLATVGLSIRTARKQAKEHVIRIVNASYNLHLESGDHDAADAIAIGCAAFRRMLRDMQ